MTEAPAVQQVRSDRTEILSTLLSLLYMCIVPSFSRSMEFVFFSVFVGCGLLYLGYSMFLSFGFEIMFFIMQRIPNSS